jgi:hypothetical protein
MITGRETFLRLQLIRLCRRLVCIHDGFWQATEALTGEDRFGSRRVDHANPPTNWLAIFNAMIAQIMFSARG